jgi:hypothetical protein
VTEDIAADLRAAVKRITDELKRIGTRYEGCDWAGIRPGDALLAGKIIAQLGADVKAAGQSSTSNCRPNEQTKAVTPPACSPGSLLPTRTLSASLLSGEVRDEPVWIY